MSQLSPPEFPVGAYIELSDYSVEERGELIDKLALAPNRLRKLVDDLTQDQLEIKYRNWSIRQIVHHLADSHINCYVRYKWALTEASPLIKSYNETKWSETVDARTQAIENSIVILEGIHARWCEMMRKLTDSEWELTFFHPELMRSVSLREALPSYVWHADHHLGQIEWIREQHDL